MRVQLQNIKVDTTKMKIYHANIKFHIVKMYPPVFRPIILRMALHTVLNCFGLSCNSNKQHMYITIANKSCYNNSQTKFNQYSHEFCLS